jgi:hypothetical protein
MSNELARTQGNTLEGKMRYAQALATSSLLPRSYQRQPGNLLFALEYADALGVSPIHAITSIHVIEGKPTASADLIAALIRKAGHKLRVTGDDRHARAVLIRHDDPDFEFVAEWDLDKAKAAGLTGKGVWKSYPGAMLRSRAITEVARMGAPDALYGVIYTPEELGATVDAEGEPVDLGEAPTLEPEQPTEPPKTVPRQRKPVPAPEPEPEVLEAEPVKRRDYLAEIDDAQGDAELLHILWTAAKADGEPAEVLDAIYKASLPAA